ncbi:hypothetical protein CPB83DRAFT_840188 [Crepidotus variabilis]|uniref:Secreted protein n=1 Tax=Crepidotus variabilis TaxID=179855 RepID=A0A9P6E5J1_9AGAR|nr:hypothetical protein CPB83DRAFT_840188 [Crepidotus variabilis]
MRVVQVLLSQFVVLESLAAVITPVAMAGKASLFDISRISARTPSGLETRPAGTIERACAKYLGGAGRDGFAAGNHGPVSLVHAARITSRTAFMISLALLPSLYIKTRLAALKFNAPLSTYVATLNHSYLMLRGIIAAHPSAFIYSEPLPGLRRRSWAYLLAFTLAKNKYSSLNTFAFNQVREL